MRMSVPLFIAAMAVWMAVMGISGSSRGPGDAHAQTASLVVTPASGPVGAVVQVSGKGCNNSGQAAYLSFQAGPDDSGTRGAFDIPNLATDAEGEFSISFTIPSSMNQYQGSGGGAVMPGTYRFVSLPPACSTPFTVIGAASLPATGGPETEPRGRGVNQSVLIAGLVLIGLGCSAFWVGRIRDGRWFVDGNQR